MSEKRIVNSTFNNLLQHKETALKRIPLALALVLALSTGAMAAKHQCKSTNGTEFTMDVPDGWAFQTVPGGCAAGKADGSEMISVAYYPGKGLTAKAFAAALVKQMNVKPQFNKEEDDYVDFDTELNGNKVNISVTGKADDSELQVVTEKGESKELEQIFNSVTF